MSMPRLVVSGLSGGTGKTTVSLGLVRAFARRGLIVHPFKKGPDYIDTAWLAAAAQGAASTLDPFFLNEGAIRRHFVARSIGADIALVEGNRGMFDGRDVAGSTSTAEIARQIEAPVLLVVDISKMTRTTAAVVAGCKNFPGGDRITGAILNCAGNARHGDIAKRAVEELAGVPVLGVLPRLDVHPIRELRAGLITVNVHAAADKAIEDIADCVCAGVDISAVIDLARDVSPLHVPSAGACPRPAPAVRIGVVRDAVLWQYYDENLEALRDAGAELVFVSLLDGSPWPVLDGLYLGGGDLAPHAFALAGNMTRKGAIRSLVEAGMPVYAEHSGYFYLCDAFSCAGSTHAMAGIFPVRAGITEKPVRLGYMEATVTGENPFYPEGFSFKGHEYHYANLTVDSSAEPVLAKIASGTPVDVPDGLVYEAAFGSVMQVFAPAVPEWAAGFVRAATAWRSRGE